MRRSTITNSCSEEATEGKATPPASTLATSSAIAPTSTSTEIEDATDADPVDFIVPSSSKRVRIINDSDAEEKRKRRHAIDRKNALRASREAGMTKSNLEIAIDIAMLKRERAELKAMLVAKNAKLENIRNAVQKAK